MDIYNQYPAALKCEAISIVSPTISEYTNYPLENRSEFKVNLYSIFKFFFNLFYYFNEYIYF